MLPLRRRARAGFTLVELLVVIAIIAILAGMLFPVFAQAREAGRKASCLSNVRQLVAAVNMYATDHEDTLPHQRFGLAGLLGASWMNQISPYVKNGQIFRCPTDPNEFHTWDQSPHDLTVSYGYNFMFLNSTGLAEVNKPADTIVLLDSSGGEGEHT
jgi:prepilin-type N-terminal cleavage/methylation domain-containing protein